MKRLIMFFIIIFPFVIEDDGFTEPFQGSKNSELLSAISKLEPEAKILQKEDINKLDCEEEMSGLIRADFNGDGLEDYAVLLKIGNIEDTVYTYKGIRYPWRRLRVWLVVFLRKGKGDFQPIVLQRLEEHSHPAYVYISVHPPGIVRDVHSGQDVKLNLPSIQETFCGKSAQIFYWVHQVKKFNTVYISE